MSPKNRSKSLRPSTKTPKSTSDSVKLGRRDLFWMVPTAAAVPALLSSCSRPDPLPPHWASGPKLPSKAGKETWVSSVCGGCPGGCGLRARIVEGRIVGVAGNPLHPINRGALCPLGVSAPHVVYHPDRIRGPLVRRGGELKAATWDEALAEVSGRMKDLRSRNLAHTVALVDGNRGLAREVAAAFLAAFGSPNHIHGRPWNDSVPGEALKTLQGVTLPAAYDLENARYIMAFGSGWLEGSSSPVATARAYALARRGRKTDRAHVVHFEARLSVSAAHADEWVPLMPGTEGVLALGLMHMILREGLEDRDFIDRWGNGFEFLRAIVLRDYHPDAVSERTGVPTATIIRLARQFASKRPAVALGDEHNGPGAQTVEARMAIHALNALVGSVNAPGGVLSPPQVPTDPLPTTETDDTGKKGLAMAPVGGGRSDGVTELLAWQEGGGSYPVNLLLAYGSDPMGVLGGGERVRTALRRVPFLVSFSSFLDDTAKQADVVLPDHTYLEKWQDDPSFTTRGFPVLGIRQPILKPRFDTRHSAEVLAELARGVGGPTAAALPWKDFKEVLQTSVKGVHRSARGSLFDVVEAEPWVETMERSGWRASNLGSFDEFWAGLVARGGWWDPIYDFGERTRALRTPSGRFEFGPLAKAVEKAFPGAGTGTERGAPSAPSGFPLRLHLYPLLAAFGDSSAPLPWVQDVLGREMELQWGLWVELAPPDARTLGVTTGAKVQVESAEGTVEARAKVYEGARPGVASMPLGPGGAAGEVCKRAMLQQASALAAISRTRNAMDGAVWGDTWVRIRKA